MRKKHQTALVRVNGWKVKLQNQATSNKREPYRTINNVDKKCPQVPRPTFKFRQIFFIALFFTFKATVSILPGFETHSLFPMGCAGGRCVISLARHFQACSTLTTIRLH